MVSVEGSRDSAVVIVTGCGLETGPSSSPGGFRNFLFIVTSSIPFLETAKPSVRWVSRVLSLEVKWPGREADHSPLN
jgi:hypothetical protein